MSLKYHGNIPGFLTWFPKLSKSLIILEWGNTWCLGVSQFLRKPRKVWRPRKVDGFTREIGLGPRKVRIYPTVDGLIFQVGWLSGFNKPTHQLDIATNHDIDVWQTGKIDSKGMMVGISGSTMESKGSFQTKANDAVHSSQMMSWLLQGLRDDGLK